MTFRAGWAFTFAFTCAFATLAVAAVTTAVPLAAEEVAQEVADSSPIEWSDRTVDLYVDAELRHDASVLRSDGGDWAVLLPDADEAWVLSSDEDSNEDGDKDEDGGSVRLAPATDFTWTEPLLATSTAVPAGEPIGTWTEVDGGWVARAGDRSLLALPHQGPAGSIDSDQLWRAVPSWHRLQQAWQPEAEGEAEALEVLEALASADTGVRFEAVFGTWCGDSRRSVPKLLAATDELGLDVSLVAISRGFEEPLHYARDHRVTNVPTILVKRGDVEIGRFIERPRSASVITDLAAILQRRPVPPPERFSDDDVLLARGEYVLRTADGAEAGRETWSLFSTNEGHTRLGSRRVGESGAVTELWQRWTPAEDGGRTGFVEITRDARGERSRTRLSRRSGEEGNDAVHALTRGDAGGIVEQDLAIPTDSIVLSPGVAASGLAWQASGRLESATLTAVVVPGAGEGFAARQDGAELVHVARVELYEPGLGDVAADHVVLRRGGARPATHEWWIHSELGVPVRAEWGGSAGDENERLTAELVWLERSPE